MKMPRIVAALLLASSLPLPLAQKASPAKDAAQSAVSVPLIVDIHASPYRPKIVYRTNISNQRFDMRNATVFDMIEFAYSLGEQDDDRENAAVAGGPSWIDWDRFDLSALLPPLEAGAATPEHLRGDRNNRARSVVRQALTDRFHLKYHMGERPLPGFVVTVGKEGPRLTEAKDPSAAGDCHGERDKADPAQYTLSCTSETMSHFIADRDQDFPRPIVDRTGLTKAYDFTLKLQLGPDVHTRDDRALVFTEAFGKQLGLVVRRGEVSQPAFVVDAVDRTPTPNLPGSIKFLPLLPDLEFEVASIRSSAADESHDQIRPGGSQITFRGFNLQGLLTLAWQLPTGAMLGDALPKLPQQRYTILVKLPSGIDGRAVNQDPDQIAAMLQKLLIDRFGLKLHWGEWTQPNAYVLYAASPKMKKADPGLRSFCKFGPAEGEKPARYAGSPFDAEFHCQNVTMAQFADRLQAVAGSDIKNRVPDRTGLTGSYTFTVFFTTSRTLRARTVTAESGAEQAGEATESPVDGRSLEDAFRKELGLRLKKRPVTMPALILDHFDQTPTEN